MVIAPCKESEYFFQFGSPLAKSGRPKFGRVSEIRAFEFVRRFCRRRSSCYGGRDRLC